MKDLKVFDRRFSFSMPKSYRDNFSVNRNFSDLFELFRVLKFHFFYQISGFPLNLIAKTASPGPDVSVPSLGSMKTWQN